MNQHCDAHSAPVAIIDVGTNTIRLLIGGIKDKGLIRLASERSVTRLGKGISKNAFLNSDSLDKSITSVIRFKVICERFGVEKIIALGTAALRDAKNSKDFLQKVKEETAIDIEIITGEREAELTLKGVLAGINPQDMNRATSFLIIDIGGGSTEWILYDNSKFKIQNLKLRMGSIPIGAVKLCEGFIRHDPPLTEELEAMKGYILKQLSTFPVPESRPLLISTGGTSTTLAQIDMALEQYDGDRIHLHNIPYPALKTLYGKLIRLSVTERAGIRGLEPERADIIIPGMLILLSVMEILGVNDVVISDYGLLEGAIVDYNRPPDI